jgi:hypothetical protein
MCGSVNLYECETWSLSLEEGDGLNTARQGNRTVYKLVQWSQTSGFPDGLYI